jgi:ubiquinone/menaquinone biosynthesis C-methylase UbiE
VRSASGADLDRAFYDRKLPQDDPGYGAWVSRIRAYFEAYAERLDCRLAGTPGVIAELGAGGCTLALCASQLPNVRRVICLDISLERMRKLVELSQRYVGGDPAKLVFEQGDFNGVLPFTNESMNAVLFDAALHHARSIWQVLGECHRVLATGGLLIAQREQTVTPFRARRQLRRLLASEEVRLGVCENSYLREQYEYYLSANGFRPEFLKVEGSRKRRLLRFLNGTLFADGVILGYRD